MNDLISRQEVLSIIYPRLNSVCTGSLGYQHLYSIIESVKQMTSYNTEDIIYDNPDEEDEDIVFKEIRNGSQTAFITENSRKATVQDFLDYLECHIYEFIAYVEVRQKNTMRVIMEIMTVTDCDGDSLYERYCYGGIDEALLSKELSS